MFEEQVTWAKESGVDFIIAETITWLEEAKIALKTIKDAGSLQYLIFPSKKVIKLEMVILLKMHVKF